MSTIQVTKTCAKATFTALDGTAKFVRALKKQLADGYQPLKDTPVLVMEALNDFSGVFTSVDEIKTEAVAGGDAFFNAIGAGAGEILGAFTAPVS